MIVSSLLLAALIALGVTSIVILRESLVAQAASTMHLSNESARSQVFMSLERTDALPLFDDFSIVVPPDGFFLVVEGSDPRLSAFFTRDYLYRPLTAGEIHEIQSQPFAVDGPGNGKDSTRMAF